MYLYVSMYILPYLYTHNTFLERERERERERE